MKLALTSLLAVSAFAPALALADSFSMAIVADNDFAVFTGTAAGVNHLLYQNNVSWENQISSLRSLTFDMPIGDTKIYLLGLGAGGEENISGRINGTDIATVSVLMSSGLQLSNYTSNVVGAGMYNAQLSEVQGNFSRLTWAPALKNTSQTVIRQASPNGTGYAWIPDQPAHLFSFDAAAVGVSAVPEPGTYALLAAGLAVVGFSSRRRLQTRVAN